MVGSLNTHSMQVYSVYKYISHCLYYSTYNSPLLRSVPGDGSVECTCLPNIHLQIYNVVRFTTLLSAASKLPVPEFTFINPNKSVLQASCLTEPKSSERHSWAMRGFSALRRYFRFHYSCFLPRMQSGMANCIHSISRFTRRTSTFLRSTFSSWVVPYEVPPHSFS